MSRVRPGLFSSAVCASVLLITCGGCRTAHDLVGKLPSKPRFAKQATSATNTPQPTTDNASPVAASPSPMLNQAATHNLAQRLAPAEAAPAPTTPTIASNSSINSQHSTSLADASPLAPIATKASSLASAMVDLTKTNANPVALVSASQPVAPTSFEAIQNVAVAAPEPPAQLPPNQVEHSLFKSRTFARTKAESKSQCSLAPIDSWRKRAWIKNWN